MTIIALVCRRAVVVCLLLIGAGCATGDADSPPGSAPQAAASPDAAAEIRDLLQEQVRAWNEGSITAFMTGYARTDTLRFASGGNVWRGWERTLQRYEETYPDEGLMGSLEFSDLEIWVTSDRHAVAFGRWRLQRSESYADIGGLFTLVLERGSDGWKIVHDHTSARDPIEEQNQG